MPEIQRERIDGARNRTERPSLLECCTGVIRPSLPSFVSRTAFDPIGWIVFNPFLIERNTSQLTDDAQQVRSRMWCVGASRQDSFDVFALQIGYRNCAKRQRFALDN